MGRRRHLAARNFYNYNETKNESQCKICGKCLTGSHISNLKRHVKTVHVEMYIAEIKNVEEAVVPEKKIKFTITMGPNELQNACVEMVTTEKMPLSFLDSQPFKTLTEQIFAGLKMTPITSRYMMDLIADKFADANEMDAMSEDKFENESEMENPLENNDTNYRNDGLRIETEPTREYEEPRQTVAREQLIEMGTLRKYETTKYKTDGERKRKASDDHFIEIERENSKMNYGIKFDGDYNFLISLLPVMKNMNEIQKLEFRAQLSNSALNIMRPTSANLHPIESSISRIETNSIARIETNSIVRRESMNIKSEVEESN